VTTTVVWNSPETAKEQECVNQTVGTGNVMLASYWYALERAEQFDPHFIISIMDVSGGYSIPHGQSLIEHIRLECHDIIYRAEPGGRYIAPSEQIVQRMIDFALGWDGHSRILTHCMGGISRSSASICVILSARNPGREHQIAKLLRLRGPWVQPNKLIIEIADGLLHRLGALIRAVEEMGPAVMQSPTKPILLPGRL
jgi:predicted protein tyrosine phosphatase